nr:hypothetical protein [Gloeobacter violaceus]
MSDNPVWLPDIGLAIGCERGVYQGIEREWLYWYDQGGQRYLTPEERTAEAARLATEAAQQAAEAERRAEQAERRVAEAQQQILKEAAARRAVEAQLQALRHRLQEQGIDPGA